jgi:hypothetical protein
MAEGGRQAASSGFQAGAARLEITPGWPQWLDGYGNRTAPSEGVYQPIYARALYLAARGGEALVLSAEVLAFDRPQAERLRQAIARATGLAPELIVLTATHTHCAPRVCDTIMPGSVDLTYLHFFEERLVEAAARAREAARPAVASLSTTRGTLGINRRVQTPEGTVMRPNPLGVNDPMVTTVWLEAPPPFGEEIPGPALASLTVYACHPTSRGGQLIGGDYPGYFSAALERRLPGPALFVLGCAGDIRPNFTSEEGRFRPAEVEEVQAAGEALAQAVEESWPRREPVAIDQARVARRDVPLPFAGLPAPETLAKIAAEDPNTLRREWAARMQEALGAGALPREVPCEVQALGLAPSAAWIFMAGEMVVDYARLLARPANPTVIPAGYANGSVGYVPSRRIYPEGGYEVDGAYLYYAQPGPFTPDAETRIVAAAEELVREVT